MKPMEIVKGIERLILAGGGVFPTCKCGAEKVATEICLSAEEEQAEEANSHHGLREISMEYSWSELSSATAGFSAARVVGRGRTATVFEGKLEEGVDVAVKVFDEPIGRFLPDEVKLLSRCHHPNIVMLLGYCIDVYQSRQALVYELLPGGSAFTRLHLNAGRPFTWEQRLRTGIHISRALAHLHKLRPEVFHRDLKSLVILFTADGVAKLVDFQNACSSRNRIQHLYAGASLVGAPGYASPEYLESGFATEASEAYSMGALLVELVTGLLPTSADPGGTQGSIIDMVRPEAEQGRDRLLSWTDPAAQWPEETAAGVAAFAIQCLHLAAEKRPSFLEIVSGLQHVAMIADQIQCEATAAASDSGSPCKPGCGDGAPCFDLATGSGPLAGGTCSAAAACANTYAAAAADGRLTPRPATQQARLLPPLEKLQQASEDPPLDGPSDGSDYGAGGSWPLQGPERSAAAAGLPASQWEERPESAACPKPQEAAVGATTAGLPAAGSRRSSLTLEERALSDGEPASVARTPPAARAGSSPRGFVEVDLTPEQPPVAKAKTTPSTTAQRARELVEGSAQLRQEEPQATTGGGSVAEPPRSERQHLRQRSGPEAAAAAETQVLADAAAAPSASSAQAPLAREEAAASALPAGEPLSALRDGGAEAEAAARGEGGGKQWLRPWNWSRNGSQGEVHGEADTPPASRWDIRDKAEAAMSRWDIRDKAEAVMSRLDLRGKGDPEAPNEARRWLQSWIRPPTPGTQAEDEGSSGEASSEDEGERRRWLQAWRRPSATPASSCAAPKRQSLAEAKSDAETPQKSRLDAPAADTLVTPSESAPREASGASAAAAREADAAPRPDPVSPNHAAIGKLFHISDLVE